MTTTLTRSARASAAFAAVLALGACASSGGGMATATPAGALPAPATSASAFFNDATVAATGSASNQDEIQTSRVALEKSRNAQVRQFAQMMVDQHTAVEAEMQRMLSAKGMAPVDNALSVQMKRNLAVTLDQLRSASGTDFDMKYMLHQIHAHDMTLKTLDTSLIPSTRDPEMRQFLQSRVRPAVAQHLQQAMQIHHGMSMGMQHNR